MYGLGYVNNKWNASFNYEAVNLDSNNEIKFENIKIYILFHNTKKLSNLSKLWIKELRKIDNDFAFSNKEVFDDAYELYMKKLKLIIDVYESKYISFKLNI